MHGFCTVFARFQNVQRVQIVAKSDKGCRNLKFKICDVSQRNDVETQLPKIEGIARRALRISRPGVRVPSIAPRKTSTHCVLVFLFCLRDGRGSNRAAAHSAASNQPSGLLLSPRVPTRRNVYRGSCGSKDFMAFLFCEPWVHGCGKSETYLQKIQDGKDEVSY